MMLLFRWVNSQPFNREIIPDKCRQNNTGRMENGLLPRPLLLRFW